MTIKDLVAQRSFYNPAGVTSNDAAAAAMAVSGLLTLKHMYRIRADASIAEWTIA